MKTHRRRFLKTAASLGAGAWAWRPSWGAPPAEKFRTALIGCGWWGMNILRDAVAAGRSKVVGLCDVYGQALEVSADEVNDLCGDQPRKYRDYRELLAKEKPQVVIIATPDHWHALPAIAAVEAGAHVFVEKPTSHTVQESRAMLNASKAAGRVMQVGLHRRIGPHHREAMDFLRSGKVGKIGMVRLFVAGRGGAETPVAHAKPPLGMDWDAWCGPAPMRPFNPRMHPGGWRNFLDYANGTLGDWGVHWLDQVMWWTDEKHPRRIYSTGGRPVSGPAVANDKEATSDAPDTQVAVFEFESFTATWEHRRYADNPTERHGVGAYFYGTRGVLHIGWRDGWTFYPVEKGVPQAHGAPRFDNEKDGHNNPPLWRDFIDAIDTKRKPVADIEAAHRSSILPMLGMISYKVGRSIQWDGVKEQIVGDPAANALLRRDYRAPWQYPKS